MRKEHFPFVIFPFLIVISSGLKRQGAKDRRVRQEETNFELVSELCSLMKFEGEIVLLVLPKKILGTKYQSKSTKHKAPGLKLVLLFLAFLATLGALAVSFEALCVTLG